MSPIKKEYKAILIVASIVVLTALTTLFLSSLEPFKAFFEIKKWGIHYTAIGAVAVYSGIFMIYMKSYIKILSTITTIAILSFFLGNLSLLSKQHIIEYYSPQRISYSNIVKDTIINQIYNTDTIYITQNISNSDENSTILIDSLQEKLILIQSINDSIKENQLQLTSSLCKYKDTLQIANMVIKSLEEERDLLASFKMKANNYEKIARSFVGSFDKELVKKEYFTVYEVRESLKSLERKQSLYMSDRCLNESLEMLEEEANIQKQY